MGSHGLALVTAGSKAVSDYSPLFCTRMEALKHHIVTVEKCGAVSCYVQGDLERQRDGVVFLTVHDLGCTFLNWFNFVMQPGMADIRKRQEIQIWQKTYDLPQGIVYPRGNTRTGARSSGSPTGLQIS